MKLGTATEMPLNGNSKYKIPYREIAASLLTGEIRTITCDSLEELIKVRAAARTSMPRFLHGKKLSMRTAGNILYLQMWPERERQPPPPLLNVNGTQDQKIADTGV